MTAFRALFPWLATFGLECARRSFAIFTAQAWNLTSWMPQPRRSTMFQASPRVSQLFRAHSVASVSATQKSPNAMTGLHLEQDDERVSAWFF